MKRIFCPKLMEKLLMLQQCAWHTKRRWRQRGRRHAIGGGRDAGFWWVCRSNTRSISAHESNREALGNLFNSPFSTIVGSGGPGLGFHCQSQERASGRVQCRQSSSPLSRNFFSLGVGGVVFKERQRICCAALFRSETAVFVFQRNIINSPIIAIDIIWRHPYKTYWDIIQ